MFSRLAVLIRTETPERCETSCERRAAWVISATISFMKAGSATSMPSTS